MSDLFSKRGAKLDLRSVPGFGAILCRRAEAHFGRDLQDVLRDNPYRLTQIESIGFLKADAAALHFGVHKIDPRRTAAAAIYVLRQAEGEGHTALGLPEFQKKLQECLGESVSKPDVGDDVVIEGNLLSRRATYDKEQAAACVVNRLLHAPYVERPADITGLAGDQAMALKLIQISNICCLTGPPGTGKTFTVKKVIDSNSQARIELCAPTGKAAKRMEQLTGHPAKTIHRLLEAHYDEKTRRFAFTRNASKPLDGDMVIVDEASMCDVRLFADLLAALRPEARLLLVGDPYQLPSVGPGRVLADLMAPGTCVPYVELTELKRQDPKLFVARNCARIRDGDIPMVDNATAGDFFFIPARGEDAIASAVVDLMTKRLPAKYGFDPNRDIVILTATREKSTLSAAELNRRLKEHLNPSVVEAFAAGDRVIQTSNNYKLDNGEGVFNGEAGTVVGREDGNLVVKFDDPERIVTEDRREDIYLDLKHAWALTTHKAQGSEWPCVIVVLDPNGRASYVQTRPHFYTAISRARQVCVVVGEMETMRAVVGRVREQTRITRLAGILRR